MKFQMIPSTTSLASLFVALLSSISGGSFCHADHSEHFEWLASKAALPKPLSDHSAALSESRRKVYLAGGCGTYVRCVRHSAVKRLGFGTVFLCLFVFLTLHDSFFVTRSYGICNCVYFCRCEKTQKIDSPQGNEYNTEGSFFFCSSLSTSLLVFDLETETFDESLPDLPRPRYRHSSAVIGNQLWLVGGRSLEDGLIEEVDIFDFDTNMWTSRSLPKTEHQVSDHASFVSPEDLGFLYVAGGYDQNYTALTQVYRIDTVASSSSSSQELVIETMAPLLEARGDISGVTSHTGDYAYVGGGFTSENGFCAPLATVEQYGFEQKQWKFIDPLQNARGEIVFLELDNHLYGMGGERQIEDICEILIDNSTDPGEHTNAVELVELWEQGKDWLQIASFPNHKFRFAAIVDRNTSAIYTFGGQAKYQTACQCFPTTTEIHVLKGTPHSLPSSSSAALTTVMATAVTGVVGGLVMLLF
jgi:N-acetylneuraminic acid mutarotase